MAAETARETAIDEHRTDQLHPSGRWHASILQAPAQAGLQNDKMFEKRNNFDHSTAGASAQYGFFATTAVPGRMRQRLGSTIPSRPVSGAAAATAQPGMAGVSPVSQPGARRIRRGDVRRRHLGKPVQGHPARQRRASRNRCVAALIAAGLFLCGCRGDQGPSAPDVDGYLPLSKLVNNGFGKNRHFLNDLHGQTVRVWGFVDHGNLYGNARAKRILQEWWSGLGPDETRWRFDLKAKADDAVGHSFAVYLPEDAGTAAMLRAFVADARARRPSKVYVTGRLMTFEAPAGLTRRTGLYLELQESGDIRLAEPHDEASTPR